MKKILAALSILFFAIQANAKISLYEQYENWFSAKIEDEDPPVSILSSDKTKQSSFLITFFKNEELDTLTHIIFRGIPLNFNKSAKNLVIPCSLTIDSNKFHSAVCEVTPYQSDFLININGLKMDRFLPECALGKNLNVTLDLENPINIQYSLAGFQKSYIRAIVLLEM
ncbi:MAG: hypothetical protein II929_07870 [Succinivibrio sp.]|nr:hypothetical protein [Succinivibrio sp.]